MLLNLPRASLRDQWIRLGALGALFGSSVIFVQLPISLWAGNAGEFQTSAWQLMGLGGAIVGIAVTACVCILWLLPSGARWLPASAVCAIALLVWVQGNFFVGDMSVLTGQGPPVDLTGGHPSWTMLAVVVGGVAAAIGISRIPIAIGFGLALLTIGLYATTIATVAGSSRSRRPPYAASPDLYRISSRENALVVVLDGLESTVAAHIIRQSSSIARAFEGFRYYPDTAGAARTTFLSLPAIHSGAVYIPTRTPGAYFTDAIKRRSFMNRFAAAGFDTVLINPVESVCPARVHVCATASELLDTAGARVTRESLQLLDLSLFRGSPAWLKRYIYNDGRWLTAGRMAVPIEIASVLEGNELLEHLSKRLRVDDGPPTLKFVHSLSTHTPYVLSDDCRTQSIASVDHISSQAKCGLLAVVSLLNRLKEAGAYDNTSIVVMADHGIDPGIYGLGESNDSEIRWRYLAGAANPVLLMKPQGSRGSLTEVDDPLQVTDVGRILCAQSRTCRVVTAAEPIKTAPNRTRLFNDYEWRQGFWRLRTIDNLTTYEIRGPVLERSSWNRRR